MNTAILYGDYEPRSIAHLEEIPEIRADITAIKDRHNMILAVIQQSALIHVSGKQEGAK